MSTYPFTPIAIARSNRTGSACIVRNISRVRSSSSASLLRDLEPVESGHPDVEYGDIGRQAANRFQSGSAVGDHLEHLQVGLPLDDLLQAVAEDRVVVGDNDANVSGHGVSNWLESTVYRTGARFRLPCQKVYL